MFSKEDKAKIGNCHPFSCSHTMVLLWGWGSGPLSCPATHSQSHARPSVLAQPWLQPKAQKTTRHRIVRGLKMTQGLQESIIVSKKKSNTFRVTAWLVHVFHSCTIQKVDKLTLSEPKHPCDNDSNFWLKRKASPVPGGIATYIQVIGTENGVVCFLLNLRHFLLSSS